MPVRSVLFSSLLLWVLCSACNSKEKLEIQRLRTENDSLRAELQTRYAMVEVMNDIKILMDSIDDNRKVLRSDLREGTTFEYFTDRLKDINKYVKNTEAKIADIQKKMKRSNRDATAYLMMVDALKSELSIRVEEIATLEASVAQIRDENTGLVNTVKLQEVQMSDMASKIETREQELKLLEAKVTEMIENFKVTEAEAYYARAKAVEEAAKRTRLARSKKKETYREALELYKKAYSLGKKEARANIRDLEKKIK
jgi:chromosome segregation ATPase